MTGHEENHGREACGWLQPEELERIVEGGSLDGGRQAAFERHLEDCEECRLLLEEVRAWRELVSTGATERERRLFRAHDRSLGAGDVNRRRFNPGRLLLVAAAVIVAVALVVVFRPGSGGVLFPDFSPPAFLPPPVVRGRGLAEAWEGAARAWRAGRYRRAEAILEAEIDRGNDDPDLLLQAGFAALMARRPARAAALLERVCGDGRREGAGETCLWYLAVARDRSGDTEGACRALARLAAMGGERAVAAARLVEQFCRDMAGDGVGQSPPPGAGRRTGPTR